MQSLFECIFTNFKEKLLPLNDYFQEITMKRFLSILLLVSLFCGTEASAKRRNTQQLPEEMLSPTKTFAESLRDDYTHFYNSGGVFEKLYLMTDRPYYSAGETLYFSGYLVHATMLTRNSASNFIYVELISPEGRLVERVKIAATNKQFIGTFMLSARLTSGRYKLRAYTRWMMNFDMGYFFTKDVYIGNAIDDAITTSISYSEGEKGQFIANICCVADPELVVLVNKSMFLAKDFIPVIEKYIKPTLGGKEADNFRQMAADMEAIQVEGKRLHTAIRYGVSQAILDAVRALGFNFHFITGFCRRFFQRLSGHKSVSQAHRAGT